MTNSKIRSKKIVLLGFRGVGKTTLAKRIKNQIGVKCVDLDYLIEKTTGKKISDLVKDFGWEYFRKQETLQLKEVLNSPESLVISCGGGVGVNFVEITDKIFLSQFGYDLDKVSDYGTLQKKLLENYKYKFLITLDEEKLKKRLIKIYKYKEMQEQRPSFGGLIESYLDQVNKDLEVYAKRARRYKHLTRLKIDGSKSLKNQFEQLKAHLN